IGVENRDARAAFGRQPSDVRRDVALAGATAERVHRDDLAGGAPRCSDGKLIAARGCFGWCRWRVVHGEWRRLHAWRGSEQRCIDASRRALRLRADSAWMATVA